MILKKQWQQLFLLSVCFLAVSGAGDVDADQAHETKQKSEQNSLNPPDLRDATCYVYRRWFTNGVLAEETMFAHGKRNGRHRLWYENGNRKLTGSFVDDRLDGVCLAWYEDGKPRLSIRFDQGKRTGEWTRTGEKVGVVARVSFENDHLDGPLMVSVNRGYGNGSGRSLELEATYGMGRLVSSFLYKETDSSGNHLQLAGTVQADGRLQLEEKKNLTIYSDGSLTSRMGDIHTTHRDLDHLFASKIEDRVMPMFTLEFCGIQVEMAP